MKRLEQQAAYRTPGTAESHRTPMGREVFAEYRQRQYPRGLRFSTVVELMTLASLALRPSLHAAATLTRHLPVSSLAALYEKVNRIEPAIPRVLVQGSAQHLEPVPAALPRRAWLPAWRVRVLEGNQLAASEKLLAALREQRDAALPRRSGDMAPQLECAGPGELRCPAGISEPASQS